MASVAGLAPARVCLKGRARELLCIHGQKWLPRLVSRQRLLVFSEALICLSYSGELVVPAGNAPASSGYQPGALLLSYETRLESGGWCRDCTHAARRLTRFSGPGHYCSANHPKWSGWQELHLRPPRSEQGRLLLTLHPEKWLPDLDSHQDKRLNRPPCYFDTTWQWRCRQESHLHLRR